MFQVIGKNDAGTVEVLYVGTFAQCRMLVKWRAAVGQTAIVVEA